jgi:hypothetical protein
MLFDRSAIVVLRLEGLALAAVCVWLYAGIHEPWWLFALLFLAPDLSMLFYLGGARLGAVLYNIVHTWVAPVVLFVIAWWGGGWLRAVGVTIDTSVLLPLAFILGAHIGVDRALGYGLKLPAGFKDTHLGRVGRPVP